MKRITTFMLAIGTVSFAPPLLAEQLSTYCREDFDQNLVVDLADYLELQACLTGPGHPVEDADCKLVDLNRDGRVDLHDLAILQNKTGDCWLCEPVWTEVYINGSSTEVSIFNLQVYNDGSGPNLHAGGIFEGLGERGISGIAKWDGLQWFSLGSGTDHVVYDQAVFDDGTGSALFVGGKFYRAGSFMWANRIAKWNGTEWYALGSGVMGLVYALTVFDDGAGPSLYVGGWLLSAGDMSVNHMARWDGSSWSAVGKGMNNTVDTLAVFDGAGGTALYAGGRFTMAGGVPANYIAKWDGASWTALGTGLQSVVVGSRVVNALTVYDDGSGSALFVAGNFDTAGGVTARGIAKWDGTQWHAVRTGLALNGYITRLVVFDDGAGQALYAVGSFNAIDGVAARNVARWDGAAWSPLGRGINGTNGGLVVFDDGSGPALYVGGRLYVGAGTNLGPAYLSKWQRPTDCDPPAPSNGEQATESAIGD